MMAATAITTNLQKRGKPVVRAKAPVTGPVRLATHVCTTCYGNGFTIEAEKSDNYKLRKENKKLKIEIKTLKCEMEEIISKMENFLDNVPLGNHQEVNQKKQAVDLHAAQEKLKEKEKEIWTEREKRL